jgi:allantoinase
MFSAVWTEAARRGHTLQEAMEWLSYRPAKFVGRTSELRPGAEASFIAFDPDARFVVRGTELQHRHPLTPYEGLELQGLVRQTWIRGLPATAGVGATV